MRRNSRYKRSIACEALDPTRLYRLLCVTASNYKMIASEYGVPTGKCGTCLDWPRVAERFAGIDYRAVQSDKPELSRGDHWLTCIDVPCIAVWDVRCLHDFVDMGYTTYDEICNNVFPLHNIDLLHGGSQTKLYQQMVHMLLDPTD
ncbi:hypothetical protein WJX79_001216 [Trebouxia sp. C0005]